MEPGSHQYQIGAEEKILRVHTIGLRKLWILQRQIQINPLLTIISDNQDGSELGTHSSLQIAWRHLRNATSLASHDAGVLHSLATMSVYHLLPPLTRVTFDQTASWSWKSHEASINVIFGQNGLHRRMKN